MRSVRKTKPGQSMVIIALVLLVLVAATGLAVDGGNAYQNQRNLDHVAGAASLAGMSYVAQRQTSSTLYPFTNSQVRATIENTLQTNRVTNYVFTTSATAV